MTEALANTNFHKATAKSVFDAREAEPRFLEYRRRWNEYPRTFTVAPFPTHLDIESTGVCNLRCPFCATGTKNWGPNERGYMEMDLFKKIIDEGAAEKLFAIKLSFRGEPTLHQQLPEMVAYAKQQGILDVYFNTNGTLLTEKLAHRLIDAGLDRISISFEGIEKEPYEKSYRVGAKYDRVIENVRRLKGIRDGRGLGIPQIRIQSVLLPELKEAFPKYLEFWKPYADEISYLDMRREGPADDHRGLRGDWACPYLWQRMTILWDGTTLPCPMPGLADFSLLALGNAREKNIREMWSGPENTRYRRLHQLKRAHELEACDRCSFRASEMEKLGMPR